MPLRPATRYFIAFVVVFAAKQAAGAPAAPTIEVSHIPSNTWVALNYTTEHRTAAHDGTDSSDPGAWGTAGWNKLLYDADGDRILFYDRWLDKRHGGGTIYGNCLFAFDPVRAKITPLKVDNWDVQHNPNGTYWTIARPENAAEPTPCPRHVYQAFDFVPEEESLFICNGANGTAAVGGKLVWEKECENTWRLDLHTMRWSRLTTEQFPPNELDASMAYCPDTRSIIYSGKGKIWILDLDSGHWRKAKHDTPTGGGGQTVVYDPPRKRMLLAGGLVTDPSVQVADRRKKDPGCDKLYAFDPRTESITRLADCPTALYEDTLTFDPKQDAFFAAVTMRFPADGLPSGTFSYDPNRDNWQTIPNASPPDPDYWAGWMRMCYDPRIDCFIGLLMYDRWYAMRYVPAADRSHSQPASLPTSRATP